MNATLLRHDFNSRMEPMEKFLGYTVEIRSELYAEVNGITKSEKFEFVGGSTRQNRWARKVERKGLYNPFKAFVGEIVVFAVAGGGLWVILTQVLPLF